MKAKRIRKPSKSKAERDLMLNVLGAALEYQHAYDSDHRSDFYYVDVNTADKKLLKLTRKLRKARNSRLKK